MKQIFVGIVLLCSFLPIAAANIYITEVMYAPTQMSDSEGEWIELYNDDEESINLNDWTLDGKSLVNQTIQGKSYFVIARELLDDTDLDSESFESYWGNNNGIWDENFYATELSLSLKEEDTIIISNSLTTEEFYYNSSYGGKNGHTIERVSLTQWQEGQIDGTPGFGNFSTQNNNGNSIYVYLNILNGIPEILAINLTDDSQQEGTQILPVLKGEKTVFVEVLVNESDGFEDLKEVYFSVLNKTGNLSFKENITANIALFNGNFTLPSTLSAGEYPFYIQASDNENLTQATINFTYEGIVSTELNLSSFEIALHSGDSTIRSVEIINEGNIAIDTEISAQDLHSQSATITSDSIEVFQDVWLPLTNPVFLDLNVAPQATEEIQFRIQAPSSAKSGKYEGKIVITSIESDEIE